MSKQRQKHRATVARDYYYCISRKFAHAFTYRHPHGWRKLACMSRSRRRDIYGAAGPAYFGANRKRNFSLESALKMVRRHYNG